jgi:hypothetical protein
VTLFVLELFRWNKMSLRPTTWRPIRLGVWHPFGAHDNIFPFIYQTVALFFSFGVPCLTREWVCSL